MNNAKVYMKEESAVVDSQHKELHETNSTNQLSLNRTQGIKLGKRKLLLMAVLTFCSVIFSWIEETIKMEVGLKERVSLGQYSTTETMRKQSQSIVPLQNLSCNILIFYISYSLCCKNNRDITCGTTMLISPPKMPGLLI